MKKIWVILVLFCLVLSTALKIIVVKDNNFPFTMDQGRDMVDLRQMVVSRTPRLVGPTTSINGVLLGPSWYYFLLPAYLISGGDPQVIMYWQIAWYQISALILWWVIKKKNLKFASIIAILLLFSPVGFRTGRYFWNANAMPIFTVFYITSFYWLFEKINSKRLIFHGIVAGLALQIEAAFGILFFPFSFIFLFIKRRNFKELIFLFSGFALTLVPQVLFEIKHNFPMTKLLLSEFTGGGNMLGEKLIFKERFTQRLQQYGEMFSFSIHFPISWLLLLFFVGLLIFIFQKKTDFYIKNSLLLGFGFVVFSLLFYLYFSQSLKPWYLLGLPVFFLLILSIPVYLLINSDRISLRLIGSIALFLTVFYGYDSQVDFIKTFSSLPSNDRSNLKNEITAIDWVYEKANGRGFKAYSYLPSVYDYPYHFLYWWYGSKKFQYQPAEVAYLPNQPEYIKDNVLLWKNTRPQDESRLTFLIIEKDLDMPSRETNWLGNFSTLCLLEEKDFGWNATVKMLARCSEEKN